MLFAVLIKVIVEKANLLSLKNKKRLILVEHFLEVRLQDFRNLQTEVFCANQNKFLQQSSCVELVWSMQGCLRASLGVI